VNFKTNQFGLTERDMKTIQNIFMKYADVNEVHLFGSRAKGNFNAGSDIDLVIMNDGLPPKTISLMAADFEESSLPYYVDLADFHAIKALELIDHIKRVGVLFYKRPQQDADRKQIEPITN
jgi:predicted nucleotidyltransferase